MHIADLNAADYLTHGPDWHADRALGIGGSDAVKIVKGEREELEALRLEKLGRQQPDDLTNVLAVQMGSWTEPLNRLWLSRALGQAVSPGMTFVHPDKAFMRANIDGITGNEIVECKHCNAFTKMDDAVVRYFPQLQHNMAVYDAKACYLSVFIGTDKHEFRRIERDDAYIASLIEAEQAFWTHVVMDVPIDTAKTIETPAVVPIMRDVDMTGSNSWAAGAQDWLMLRDQAKAFEKAGKDLKGLMEADMRRGHGHGIEIVRDGRGLTIKELKLKKEAA